MTELTLEQRVELVRQTIDEAANGRPVTLVGVTKTKPADMIVRAIKAGIDTIGENYVQEYREKDAAGAYKGAKVHIIGHLQTNKVKYVAGKVDMIQSVDSLALLEAIDRRAGALQTVQDVLIEVNIGREPDKAGCAPEALDELLARAGQLASVRVRGLMAIPPAECSRAYFAPMYNLFVDNCQKKYDNVSMDFLSMGMSDDFADAVRQGANMVRVGSLLFGPCNYI